MEEKFSALRELVGRMGGQRLPGERELAGQLQVSRPTLRAWLDVLEQEGSIQRRQGSGTYAIDVQAGPALRSISLLIDASLKLGDDPFVSLLVDQLLASTQAERMQCAIERIDNEQAPLRLKDGAILIGQAGWALIRRISALGIPIVCMLLTSEITSHERVTILQTADREAGTEAAAHLLRAGCQRLIFIGKQEVSASWERWQGARQVAQQAGLEIEFRSCSLNYQAGLHMGRELAQTQISGVRRGIIATNDWLALGVRTGLLGKGISLEQSPLVSFDGLAMTEDPALGIASLRIPIATMTDDAIKELQRLARHRLPSGRTVRYPLSWRATPGA